MLPDSGHNLVRYALAQSRFISAIEILNFTCIWYSNTSQNIEMNFRIHVSGFDPPKSLKHVVTASLLNARHQVRVSRVLEDDHNKWVTRATVGVALKNPHWSTVIISYNLRSKSKINHSTRSTIDFVQSVHILNFFLNGPFKNNIE